jgi:hypothetical protein
MYNEYTVSIFICLKLSLQIPSVLSLQCTLLPSILYYTILYYTKLYYTILRICIYYTRKVQI